MEGDIFGVPTVEWIGVVIAFAAAAVMIYIDCHQVITGVIRYVPDAFFASSRLLALAAAGGAVAGAIYLLTTPAGGDVVSHQIGVKQADPFLRALIVGVVSLALIRSKFFKIPQGDFGGEYIYVQLRDGVLQPIIVGWNVLKTRFIEANVVTCLATADFVGDTLATVRQVARTASPEDALSALSQVDQVEKSAPTTAFSTSAPEWNIYYRGVIRLALDACGPSIFSDPKFIWPK